MARIRDLGVSAIPESGHVPLDGLGRFIPIPNGCTPQQDTCTGSDTVKTPRPKSPQKPRRYVALTVEGVEQLQEQLRLKLMRIDDSPEETQEENPS